MDKYSTPIVKAYSKVVSKISSCNWTKIKATITKGPGYDLLPYDHEKFKSMLAKDYYIILTRRETHLSTYAIGMAGLLKTGQYSYWSHALMNMEGEDPVHDDDFKLVEATSRGVHPSSFMEVFDCDWAALLKPKHIKLSDWTDLIDSMLVKENGKPYDDLFDLADSSHLSCVELVRVVLQSLPDYETKFAHFESMIKKYGNLTPEMYYRCDDFELVYEIRR